MGEIILGNKKIKYIHKKSRRARLMRLTIREDSSLTVVSPGYLNDEAVADFLYRKASWILAKLEFYKNHKSIISPGSRADYLKNKELARRLVLEKINKLNQAYGFKFNRIAVRNQKSRWGSCSRVGNLNFNYRIIYLPEDLADYLIVHELCHLQEFNHSPRFWRLVAATVPGFREKSKSLRRIAPHH